MEHIFISEKVDSKVKMIDFILNQSWNNIDFERDETFHYYLGDKCAVLRLGRDDVDFEISICIQKLFNEDTWEDVLERIVILNGELINIEKYINEEFYNNIPTILKNSISNTSL